MQCPRDREQADAGGEGEGLEGFAMPRGRKTSLTICLKAEERQTLLAWQRSTIIPAGRARRGRIILLLADSMSLVQIAAMVGISRRFVYNGRSGFCSTG